VPLAKLGSFVLIQAVVDAELCFAVLKCVSEIQIRGRIVNGISAKDNQQIDFTALNIIDEILQ